MSFRRTILPILLAERTGVRRGARHARNLRNARNLSHSVRNRYSRHEPVLWIDSSGICREFQAADFCLPQLIRPCRSSRT